MVVRMSFWPSANDALRYFSLFDLGISAAIAACALTSLYIAVKVSYNIYFHPLAHIPGPKLAAATRIPYSYRLLNGSLVKWLKELHDRYGEVVRYAPNDVSFISGETAWQDIYGHRTGKSKTPPYQKDLSWYLLPANGVYGLFTTNEVNHTRMRRSLAPAFSDKALREQESLIQSYDDLLIHCLGEQIELGKPVVDMTRWYNYTTFDIITDLCFGEPLYCLRDNEYHFWVFMVFQSIKAIGVQSVMRRFPFLFALSKKMIPKEVIENRKKFFYMVSAKATERLQHGVGRPDVISYYLKNKSEVANEEESMTKKELDSNLVAILAAGSETTATLLSGTTYMLLKHPAVLSKLIHEIRSRFHSLTEITIEEVNKLPYLIACLQEGMRMYPPVPAGFTRVVPPGGGIISGHFIPEGTSVSMSQHAAYHSSRNFVEPDSYIPERWLADAEPKFKADKTTVLQPFSVGPRNCLGKSMAYAEMRLILAKILFSFDLKLANDEGDWMDQKVFTLWEKSPLMVELTVTRK